jgi:uncharacterized membrane protein
MATTRHAAQPQQTSSASLPDHISHNLETIQALAARADDRMSRAHRPIEAIGMLLGQPAFFYGIVLLVAVWVLINTMAPRWGLAPFDPAPYYWLQGLVGLGAWLTATSVLIMQTRQGKLAEQRAHLELQ